MPLFGDATGFVCSQGEYRPINKHLQRNPDGSENPVAAYPTVVGSGRMNGRSGNVIGVTKGPGAGQQGPDAGSGGAPQNPAAKGYGLRLRVLEKRSWGGARLPE